MRSLLQQFIQKPRTVDILVGLIVGLGLLALSTMRSNFLPPEPVSLIRVNVVYRGASPQEVEEEVVNKIEDRLDGLKGVDLARQLKQSRICHLAANEDTL